MTDPPETPPWMPPASPPTAPGAMVSRLAPAAPAWVAVLGILSIVFGVLGALSKCWGMATPLFFSMMDRFFASMPEEEVPEAVGQSFSMMGAYAWPIAGVSLLKTVVAGLLVAVGIGLLKQRAWAPAWAIRYAVLDMVLTLGEGTLGALAQVAQMDAMQAADPTAFGPIGRWTTLIAYGSVGLGVLVSLVWPVFLIVWFTRRRVREQTSTWT
ncbi:MAG TPA: hypothetical protein PLU35_07935 [Phycisphaerales bacterium]|nr:hypothetical protein [Phycisphaerales bacterium]